MKYKDSFNQCKHNSTACETRPRRDGWLSWLARNCGAAPFKYIIDSVWSVQWAEPARGRPGASSPGPCSEAPAGPAGLQPGWLLALLWEPRTQNWMWVVLQLLGLAEDLGSRTGLPRSLEKGPLSRALPRPWLQVLGTKEVVGLGV